MVGKKRERHQIRSYKLTPPQLPPILKRKHLFAELDRGRKTPITWLVGPPGAGKTTLVASYLKERRLPTLWYQLDEDDNDVASFYHYFRRGALASTHRSKRSLPHLSLEYQGSIHTFTRRFFEEVFRRCAKNTVFVFDNYQDVPDDSELHNVLEVALNRIPDGLTCLCLSRKLPPGAFAQLEAKQFLRKFNPDKFRLSSAEISLFARLHSQQRRWQPTSHTLKQIEEETNGWFAGLLLLIEEASGVSSINRIRGRETPTVLFDYLAREAIGKLGDDKQKFLFKTAFLPYMTDAMAEHLTGVKTAGRILNHLYQTRHFTERRIEEALVYQYHPLFRDVLLMRAKEVFHLQEVQQLQVQAAKLLEKSNRIEAAVDLLEQAGEPSELTRIILANAANMFAQGRIRTLHQWLSRLPNSIMDNTPWALFWQGVCIGLTKQDEGQQLLVRAFEEFLVKEDKVGQLSACCAMVESIMSSWIKTTDLALWSDRLQSLITEPNHFSSPDLEARATFAIFISQQWRDPNEAAMRVITDLAEKMLGRNLDYSQTMYMAPHLVSYRCWMGEWEAAEAILRRLQQHHGKTELSPLAKIWFYTAHSSYDVSVAQIDRCLTHVDRGLDLGRSHALESTALIIAANGALAALSVGNNTLARKYVNQVPDRGDLSGLYHHILGWDAILRNDLNEAFTHIDAAIQSSVAFGSFFPEAFNRIPMAQILHEQGKYAEAVPHLTRVRELIALTGSPILRWNYELLEAQIGFDQGTEEKGFRHLRQALSVGRQRQILNWLWWRPTVMARLYGKALEAGIESEYVRHVIKTRRLQPDSSMRYFSAWPWPVVIRTLGTFEICLDERPIRFTRKAQERPLDLLKAVIALGGFNVPETMLTDALWPDADGDAAHQAFATTLHRLRKLIGVETLVLKGGKLSLADHICFVDVWAFEHILHEVDLSIRKNDLKTAQEYRERAISLYKGSFLTDDTAAWADSLRQRLRRRFTRMIIEAAKEFVLNSQRQQALSWIDRGLEREPNSEELHHVIHS